MRSDMSRRCRPHGGFTFIELIIVIMLIVACLAAVVFVNRALADIEEADVRAAERVEEGWPLEVVTEPTWDSDATRWVFDARVDGDRVNCTGIEVRGSMNAVICDGVEVAPVPAR